MDHVHLYLFGRELDHTVGESLDGSVHITLDDDIEFLEVTDRNTAADLFEGHMFLGLDTLDADKLLALIGDALRFLLVCHYDELLTCGRSAVQTEDRHRGRRTGLLNLLSALVEHTPYPSEVASAEDAVSGVEGSILD